MSVALVQGLQRRIEDLSEEVKNKKEVESENRRLKEELRMKYQTTTDVYPLAYPICCTELTAPVLLCERVSHGALARESLRHLGQEYPLSFWHSNVESSQPMQTAESVPSRWTYVADDMYGKNGTLAFEGVNCNVGWEKKM